MSSNGIIIHVTKFPSEQISKGVREAAKASYRANNHYRGNGKKVIRHSGPNDQN